jgi:hypothetical protein
MAKKPLTFWKADEVKAIAESLIEEFHEHIADLTVLYVFRSEHAEEAGKVVLGKAKKVTGLNAYLAWRHLAEEESGSAVASFYVVEIAHDTWCALTGPQRIALVDHELSHIGPDGIVSHDIEEFRGVIERHGLWRPALEEFIEASKQVPLFDNKADRLARDPKIRKAFEQLVPKKGSGIDSVTISTPGHEPVTIHARD